MILRSLPRKIRIDRKPFEYRVNKNEGVAAVVLDSYWVVVRVILDEPLHSGSTASQEATT
jgi:hypothetical protein